MLTHDDTICTCELRGLSLIMDSTGELDNASFYTLCTITTSDNTTQVSYYVEFFSKLNKDHCFLVTNNYEEAVNRYNELLVIWDADKHLTTSIYDVPSIL